MTFSGNKNGAKLIQTKNVNLHFCSILAREAILGRSYACFAMSIENRGNMPYGRCFFDNTELAISLKAKQMSNCFQMSN